MSPAPHQKVLVAGATGAIGRKCVQLLVRDPRVQTVTAVVRGDPKEAAFYDLSPAEVKQKLVQVKVDFSQLPAFPPNSFTAGLSALGVYTADVDGMAEFMQREHTPNLAIAQAGGQAGAQRWAYLSGLGVKPFAPEAPKPWTTPMFSYCKGRVEHDLATVPGFQHSVSIRPGGILGRPGEQPIVERVTNRFPSLGKTPWFVHRDDISKAMVHGILGPLPALVLENEDIKAAAAVYDASLREVVGE